MIKSNRDHSARDLIEQTARVTTHNGDYMRWLEDEIPFTEPEAEKPVCSNCGGWPYVEDADGMMIFCPVCQTESK